MSVASKEIRDRLETLLANDLGTYTLATKQDPVPAIWHGLEPPSNDRTVSGLECIVIQTPDMVVTPMFSNQAAIDRDYTVRLINHGTAQISEEVIAKIVYEFPHCQITPIPASSIAPEQYVFTFSAQPIRVS